MKDVKVVILMIAAILLSLSIIAVFVSMFAINVPLHQIEKEEAIVVEKVGKKELYKGPTYRVLVELANGDNTPSTELHRVSKGDMETLEQGDQIEGYSLGTYPFTTFRDLSNNIIRTLPLLIISIILFISVIYGLIIVIAPLNKKVRKRSPHRDRPKKHRIAKVVLGIVVIGLTIHSVQYVVNGFHKVVPVNQTITEAEIIDKYIEEKLRAPMKQRHILRLAYENEAGEAFITDKTVAGSMYDRYFKSQLVRTSDDALERAPTNNKISISYETTNPYNVFIKDSKPVDVFLSLVYSGSLVHIAVIIGLVIFGWVMVRKRVL